MPKVTFSIPLEGSNAADVKVRASKDLIAEVICNPTHRLLKGIKRGTGNTDSVPTIHGCDLKALGNGYYSIRGDTDAVVDDLAHLEDVIFGDDVHPDLK